MRPIIVPIRDALHCAVETAKYQRGEVPIVPTHWIEQTEKAIEIDDADAMAICAKQILTANAQYRADFDIKGWLFDLRNATAN